MCPCPEEHKAYWTSLSNERLASHKRTKSQADLDDTDGSIRLYFNDQEETTYTNFKDCFEALQSSEEAKAQTDNYKEIALLEAKKQSLDLVEFLEKKYSCSAICTPGLFYYSLDLSAKVPMETCLLSIKGAV